MLASDYYFYVEEFDEEFPIFAISPLSMYPRLDDSEDMDEVVEQLINPTMRSYRIEESTYETDEYLEKHEIISKLKKLGFIYKSNPNIP